MRSRIFLIGITIAALMGIIVSGCDSSTTAAGGGGGEVDASVVGVWFTLSDTSGLQIAADGVATPLTINGSGSIVVNSEATIGVSYKIQISGGKYTLTVKQKSPLTNNDTTITIKGTYTLSADKTQLTVTQEGQSAQLYFKTALGANAFTGGGSVDAAVVGVWFTLSDTTGFEVTSGGTYKILTVDNSGKIIVATIAGYSASVTTNNGSATITERGPSWLTGNDTTITSTVNYSLSNGGNTLTLSMIINGQTLTMAYFKTTIGANAFTGGGGGSNTFSFTVDGTTYNGSVVNPTVNGGFFSATGVDAGTSLNIMVQASTGTKQVSASAASGFLSTSSSSYSSTGGSITVTSFSATNIKGTINLTMTQSSGTGTKTVTGSFDINY